MGNLETLANALRRDCQTPAMPFFVATYFSEEELSALDLNNQFLQRNLRARPEIVSLVRVQANAGKELPNVYSVFHGIPPLMPDGIHFNAEGQLLLGNLFADAYEKNIFYTRKGSEE